MSTKSLAVLVRFFVVASDSNSKLYLARWGLIKKSLMAKSSRVFLSLRASKSLGSREKAILCLVEVEAPKHQERLCAQTKDKN